MTHFSCTWIFNGNEQIFTKVNVTGWFSVYSMDTKKSLFLSVYPKMGKRENEIVNANFVS